MSNYYIIRIQRYLNGELSGEEMHQLEREALDDPLLQDAIDGYRTQKEVSHRRLSLLQQRLAARIAGRAAERNAFYFGWQRLAVAATACVLMVLVLLLLWLRNYPVSQQAGEKEVQVELVPSQATAGIYAAAIDGGKSDATPVGGWTSFNAYLSENKKAMLPAGEVALTFRIDSRGKPVAIESTHRANAELLAEAKRLLAEGPKWEGTAGKIRVAFH
ncbi:hypothetical protein ACFOET_15985 [Parapedobacter deserti]|uniref:TonB C-terminal domain-containing protein n=1 Tax=Parapedobacter deserti TaxID=1912957 RepID=A0ABV7JM05_9SPHI